MSVISRTIDTEIYTRTSFLKWCAKEAANVVGDDTPANNPIVNWLKDETFYNHVWLTWSGEVLAQREELICGDICHCTDIKDYVLQLDFKPLDVVLKRLEHEWSYDYSEDRKLTGTEVLRALGEEGYLQQETVLLDTTMQTIVSDKNFAREHAKVSGVNTGYTIYFGIMLGIRLALKSRALADRLDAMYRLTRKKDSTRPDHTVIDSMVDGLWKRIEE